mgnify:FL=1
MRVMLATPTLRQEPTASFLMCVMKTMNLLAQHGIALDTCFVGGDSFIAKARNGLVQSFIETWTSEYPADVLFFVDDDQGWDEQAVLRAVLDSHEIIAAAVPKKMDAQPGDPQTFNNVMLDTTDAGECYVEHGMLRASQIGSGFMLIKRTAIEKMIAAYPQRYAPGDGGLHALHYNLFDAKVIWDAKDDTVTGQFWGEDLIFCQKWCALGGKIWVDPNVTMEHIGRKSWTGNFLEFLQKHASVQVSQPVPPANVVPLAAAPAPIQETLDAIERIAA